MDYSQLNDEALILLIARAQPKALQELYQRYHRLVFSLALHLVGDQTTAEEITLDVFLKVWDKVDTYQPDRAKVSSWLTSIARHRAIDVLRQQRSRLNGHRVGWNDQLSQIPSNHHNPEEAASLTLRREQIRWAVAQLPPEQQEVLALAYFNGYTHREIAEKLAAPLGTIKTRLRLALQKLRQILADEKRG
ncbi:MAG: sigma-70 family RNA polymerase sigma factor [Anaerolineaceae bacterium]|nr:sigma-70 family RNA polymerase sigma factor [Anaerolineaceae bacterium]